MKRVSFCLNVPIVRFPFAPLTIANFARLNCSSLIEFFHLQGTKNENTVLDYLQKMCSNNVNIPVGGITHTGMQNERGGYENDCMLIRQTNKT